MARHIPFACSFCGKAQSELLRIIAGPNGVYICAECVTLCDQILAEEPPPPARPASARQSRQPRMSVWRRLLRGWLPGHWRLEPSHA